MELKIKVDIQGAILKGKAPDLIQRNLDKAISKTTMLLWAEVLKRTPQGAGGSQNGLINSIKGDVLYKGTPAVKGIVGSPFEYAEVIEKGRKPGKGIAEAGRPSLLKWIDVKLGIQGKQAERIAFLINRKVKREGFEGHHMFEKALEENMAKITEIFRKLGLDIERDLSE